MAKRWEVDDFLALPEWRLRWSAGPVDSGGGDDTDTCLITMQSVDDIPHVAHASDGRTYDALGLRKWLSLSPDAWVVPGCPITHVDLLPYHRLCARRAHLAWRFMAHCMTHCMAQSVAQYRRVAWHRRRRRLAQAKKKEPLWKRVLEVNRRVRFPPIRKSAPLIPHPRSAFTSLVPCHPSRPSPP